MLNKILSLLGIAIMILSIVGFVYFDATIRVNSEAMGANIVVARENIPEGTVLKNADMVKQYFKVVRIPRSQVVPNALSVGVKYGGGNIVDAVKAFFNPEERQIADSDLKALINKRVTTTIYKNQQIIKDYLSDDPTEFAPDERLYAVSISYVESVGAEVHKGDYVDLWVRHPGGDAQKVIGPLKVIKLKDANNEEILGNSKAIPKLVIFKLNDNQIATVSTLLTNNTAFVVKYGITPENKTPVLGNVAPQAANNNQTK